MIRIVMIFFLGTLGCLGASDAEFRGEAKAKIEILQKQNDELKTKVDALDDKTKSIDAYKDQIQEVNMHVDRSINILAIVLALSGVLGYFSVKSRAKDEAREAAEEWFKKNNEDLKEQIEDFQNKLATLQNDAKVKTEEHNNYLENSQIEIENMKRHMQLVDLKLPRAELEENANEGGAIRNQAEYISKTKPQSEYTFNDWDTLAFDAYQQQKYNDAIHYWRKAIEVGQPTDIQYAQRLFNISLAYYGNNDNYKAIEVSNEFLERFKGKQPTLIEEQIAVALYNKGVILNQVGENQKAIEIYDELIELYKGTQSLFIKEHIGKAFNNKSIIFEQMGEKQKAIEVSDELIERFKGEQLLAIKEQLVIALYNKGVFLNLLEEKQKAIEIYDELIERFKEEPSPMIQEQIAKALHNKGIYLGWMGEKQKAIEVSDELIERFKGEQSLVIKEQIASALYNKGTYLGSMKENEKAIETYNELIERFKGEQSLMIQEKIAKALINQFELNLIINQPFDENKVEQYQQLIGGDKKQLIKLKLLQIIKDSLLVEQSEKIQKIKEEFLDTDFSNWNWSELEDWANGFSDLDAKERVLNTIEAFKHWTVISDKVVV
ncbi:tetratricopeptide repeat protein [Sulfuricurvum sp.]|uniref:tetratricopeptide repeat protein n=1 Tax=Sulfuricurvum sp. TaxID=2025608 RepID=UPI003BAEA570